MTICFFTDEKGQQFHPLTLTRPVDDLRVGIFTINEKWQKALKADSFARLLPSYLEGVFNPGEIPKKEPCLWINSRYLPTNNTLASIANLSVGDELTFKGDVVAAKINGEKSFELHQDQIFSSKNLNKIELEEADQISFLWDLVSMNASQIESDILLDNMSSIAKTGLGSKAIAENPKNIYIDEEVTIEPGCIFIANDGPIVIQKNATIEAGSILRGPVAIGNGATVKMCARIYNGTTIGPICKVGGEVSGSIFHSYSNKAHDGFVGNSIIGEWVNLGANTITSNLKNDYKNIDVIDWNSKKSLSTGKQFFGTVMGDHSKTAINTMLNTGTLCGVSSNVFIDKLSPTVIDSFTWLGPEGPKLYRFDKAIEVMKAMMKRRDIDLSDAYKKMMLHHFEKRNEQIEA